MVDAPLEDGPRALNEMVSLTSHEAPEPEEVVESNVVERELPDRDRPGEIGGVRSAQDIIAEALRTRLAAQHEPSHDTLLQPITPQIPKQPSSHLPKPPGIIHNIAVALRHLLDSASHLFLIKRHHSPPAPYEDMTM